MIKWDDLTEDQKKKAIDVYEVALKLKEFSNKCNRALLCYIFGEDRGAHLAEVYAGRCNRNLMDFINYVDEDVHAELFANILYNEDLYAHC